MSAAQNAHQQQHHHHQQEQQQQQQQCWTAALDDLQRRYDRLARDIRATLDPPDDACTLKTYQVVHMLEAKAAIWAHELSVRHRRRRRRSGVPDPQPHLHACCCCCCCCCCCMQGPTLLGRAERDLAALRRVFHRILDTAWTQADEDVVAAVAAELSGLGLFTMSDGVLDPAGE